MHVPRLRPVLSLCPTARPRLHAWGLAALLATLAPGAWADAGRQGTAPQPQPVAADPAFSTPATEHIASPAMLRAFLTELRQTRRPQSFCFVQQAFPPSKADPEGFALVWMVWTTGSHIYRLRVPPPVPPGAPNPAQDDDPAERGAALANGKSVNLRTDVVPTDEAVGSSTFLVSRPWVERIQGQCRRIGTAVRVPAFRPPPP
ncbi:hypothetical protein AVME950_14885 [Acidovorax sp. SUPP950]|uniref:hypothetical protein n=1 Tax=Acidovorax sp. SUPP950 TaxID=511901 RepID=UPI0023CF9FCC|nr:hypothetical protein [Acidovorax sp. SUPP950]GKS76195.1 hypothetical protein AVME950_14885 [Acidovorax sp. SUPP950]